MIIEIKELRDSFLEKASFREKAFYYFLKGTPIEYIVEYNSNELDNICAFSFCKNAPQKLELIYKFKKQKPIRGLHYTSNLITLCAFSLNDYEDHRHYLNKFISENKLRESFIISRLFPDLGVELNKQPSTVIENLILDIIINRDYQDSQQKVLSAMEQAEDLIDIYIIEHAFKILLDFHPSSKEYKKLKRIDEYFKIVCSFIERRYIVFKTWKIFFLLFILTILFSILAKKYWDIAEPILYVLNISFFLIVGLIGLIINWIFGKKTEHFKFEILQRIHQKILIRAYKKYGLDYTKLKKDVDKNDE